MQFVMLIGPTLIQTIKNVLVSVCKKKTRIIKHTLIRFSLQRYNRVIQCSPNRLIEFKTIHPAILPTHTSPAVETLLQFISDWLPKRKLKHVCRVSTNSFQTNTYNIQRMRRVRVNRRFSISL